MHRDSLEQIVFQAMVWEKYGQYSIIVTIISLFIVLLGHIGQVSSLVYAGLMTAVVTAFIWWYWCLTVIKKLSESIKKNTDDIHSIAELIREIRLLVSGLK